MGMGDSIEKRLTDLYFGNEEIIREGFPDAINRERAEALEMFSVAGIPSRKNERYRYCDLQEWFRAAEYESYFTPSVLADMKQEELADDGFVLPLVNGFFAGEVPLAVRPDGVIYGSLRTAMVQYPELVSRWLNRIADNAGDAMTALNTAFMQDGLFLYVPKEVQCKEPFVVSCRYGAEHEDRLCFARNLLIFEKGCSAKLIFDYKTATEDRFLTNSVREIVVGPEARVEVCETVRFNEKSAQVLGSYVKQHKDSHYQNLTVQLGGGMSRVNYVAALEEPGAENHTYGLYLCGGADQTDVSTEIRHNVPDCTSYELFKGVVSDQAQGAFNGLIYVAPDAQRTRAFQENHNLQLSDTAHVYTKPQLEIYADDVKCSHGATVGQLDADAIYYMRQRGIGENEARKLQMFGFVNDVIAKCTIEGVVSRLNAWAAEKIEKL